MTLGILYHIAPPSAALQTQLSAVIQRDKLFSLSRSREW